VATGATGEVLMVEWGAFALRDSLKRHSDNATCSAFSKDGRYLATGGWDGRVFLYDLRGGGTKEPIRVYESRGGRIHDVALHPDGRTVVAASDSGSLIIWRVPEAR
jgi:WD40 repeat protein